MTISPTIRAIETEYDKHRFRSRKEARFAVMFRALGLAYQYEPEGFDLNGHHNYLPDFFLPRPGLWVEVKGKEPAPEEFTLATLLAQADREHPVVLTWENFDEISAGDNVYFWYDDDGVFHSQRGWRWLSEPERGWYAARYARFEHGESGPGSEYEPLPY